MHELLAERFRQQAPSLNDQSADAVPGLVDAVLASAREAGASDVHLVPGGDALRMWWRIDGVLHQVAEFPKRLAPNVVSRLKVLAELLTYRTDVPQEGRIRASGDDLETRVSTFPTLFGEKAVVRLFAGGGRFRRLDDLGLPGDVLAGLRRQLDQTGGVVLLTGPAGSGKTTTIYACLREIAAAADSRSLVSLEDPIEVVVPGVAQSQVNQQAGFSMPAGLRSLLRQDPDVIMVGEIRDRETAETVFQAGLTGHLVVTTFHAGSAAQAVSRLGDMEIEPYLIRSSLLAVLSQRLLRRLCTCAVVAEDAESKAGFDVQRVHLPVGCERCAGTGYEGRSLLAEMLVPGEREVVRAILAREDATRLHAAAVAAGMVDQWERARRALQDGWTSPAEVFRVLGSRRDGLH